MHEWNEPRARRARSAHTAARTAGYALLFHDTHHRAVTDPDGDRPVDLRDYDGVLAFGDVIRERYLEHGWAARASGPGTRPPTCDVFRPRPRAAAATATWSGSATGATSERTAELQRVSDRARAQARPAGRASTAFATRQEARRDARRRRHRLRRLAAELRGARGVRAPRSPCTCRDGPMSRRCRASRPSACSRRSRAASRWSRAPWRRRRGAVPAGGGFPVSPLTAPR